MGEFTNDNNSSPNTLAASDHAIRDNGIETDVKGLFADGEKLSLPVFKVEPNEFDQNLTFGRKRVQFQKGSKAQQYMEKTRYNRPFWISTEKNGEIWTRKIK